MVQPFTPRNRVPSDAPDFTEMFNTPLNAGEQFNFKRWQMQNPGLGNPYDYDAQGFWKSGGMAASNGHGGDQFKKPNHPTFSDQSQYSGPSTGYYGGHWDQAGDRYSYTPSPQNLRMNPLSTLEPYFKEVEPGNMLMRPNPNPAPQPPMDPRALGMYPRTQSPHTRGSAVTPQRMNSGQLFGMFLGLPDRGKGATPPATPGPTTPQPMRFTANPVTPRFARPMPARPGRTLVGQE